MESWNKIAIPIRRVWIGVGARSGLKKTGLKRLKHEVKTCKYEDVRVLWEMLNKADAEIVRSPPPPKKGEKRRKRNVCSFFKWAWSCRKF